MPVARPGDSVGPGRGSAAVLVRLVPPAGMAPPFGGVGRRPLRGLWFLASCRLCALQPGVAVPRAARRSAWVGVGPGFWVSFWSFSVFGVDFWVVLWYNQVVFRFRRRFSRLSPWRCPVSALPSVSRLLWSAFRAGGFAAFSVRSSRRALGGWAFVAAFRSESVAAAFAARWAGRLGLSGCAVRVCRGRWCVSVPVAWSAGSAWPLCAVPVSGPRGSGWGCVVAGLGLRGVAALAAALAAPVPPVPPSVPPSVGFCGSRSLSRAWSRVVASVIRSLPVSVPVVVGCAAGADETVRSAARCSSARTVRVWAVASGAWGRGPSAFAARSAALVRSLEAGSWFVGFVVSPCPAGVAPARSWSSGSSVSGSWSSLALAAGRGLPVLVVWCGPGAPALPAWPGGSWSPVASVPWSSAPVGAPAFVWSPTSGLFS